MDKVDCKHLPRQRLSHARDLACTRSHLWVAQHTPHVYGWPVAASNFAIPPAAANAGVMVVITSSTPDRERPKTKAVPPSSNLMHYHALRTEVAAFETPPPTLATCHAHSAIHIRAAASPLLFKLVASQPASAPTSITPNEFRNTSRWRGLK